MNESKATRYQRLRRRAQAAGMASGGLMLALAAWPAVASRLARLAFGFSRGLSAPWDVIVALAVFVLLVVVLWDIAALPALLYVGLRLDRAYGGRRVAAEEVIGAQLQATAIAIPAAFAAGAIVLVSAEVAGAWWWAPAGVILALILAAALRAAPAILARLARTRPLGRPALRARLGELAERAGVAVAGIDEWVVADRSTATALVAGVGRTKRILVSSEIAREWAPDEVAVIVAHELAHHARGDLWLTFALDAVVLSASLLAAGLVLRAVPPPIGPGSPSDLAALPLVAFVASAAWTLATPLRHAQSRRLERQADVFALSLTGATDAFRAAVRRLAARYLAEERPPAWAQWLYARHPSIAERLALADEYGAGQRPPQ